MATVDVAFATRLDNVAVLQSFLPTEIGVGSTIVVTGVSASFNGTQTVISTAPYEFIGLSDEGDLLFNYDVIRENQVIYENTGSDVGRDTATGTIAYTPVCTWITDNDVLDWLGIDPASAIDQNFVTACTEAANAFAYRRRKSAGYADSLTVVPNAAAKLGTIQYAGMLYRERGTAGENFASFSQMGAIPVTGSMGQIMRLLGVNRARIA